MRSCARVELDAASRAHLIDAAAHVQDWDAVVTWGERHGLIPLVYHYVRASRIPLSDRTTRQLMALVLRHRIMVRAQADALGEIVGALQLAGIDYLVLKGGVLAHMIYPSPDLRPMGDLDILVHPTNVVEAQIVLRSLGFDAPLIHGERALRFHHHLPMATRRRDGALVCVEIHSDAVSPDQPCRLRLGRLSQSPREIAAGGCRLRAFDHVDMLVHLSWHVLEPRRHTRLIAVADLVGYAARYAAEIDWELLRRRHPRIPNALALMHYVTPLPHSLRELRPPDTLRAPAGVGRGSLPLRSVGRQNGWRTLKHIVYPPEWWMRVYYGVPPGRSLTGVRWSRHIWRILYWLGRRVFAVSMPVRPRQADSRHQPDVPRLRA